MGHLAYFQTQNPSMFTSPLTLCVFVCLLSVTEACCPLRAVTYFILKFSSVVGNFILPCFNMEFKANRKTSQNSKSQRDLVLHWISFCSVPSHWAGLLGGDEKLGP